MAATHVVYSYYTVPGSSTTAVLRVRPRKQSQSDHILVYMYEPYKNSKTVATHSRFLEAAYLLLLTLLLLFRRKKNILFNAFSYRPKTPLVACVFYLDLICTCFWLNVNRYAWFWHANLTTNPTKRYYETSCKTPWAGKEHDFNDACHTLSGNVKTIWLII